jgi:hypothetical protein
MTEAQPRGHERRDIKPDLEGQAEAAVHLAVTVAQCFNTKICQVKEMGSSGWSWDGPRP